MTSKTTHYIELSDILAFRFECKNEECGARLELPLSANVAQSKILRLCPQCKTAWADLNGSLFESLFKALTDTLGKLEGAPFGFKLYLEVKPTPEREEKRQK